MKQYVSIFLILLLLLLSACTHDPEPTSQSAEAPQTSAIPAIQTQPVTTQPATTELSISPETTTFALPETTTAVPVLIQTDITHGIVSDNVYICGFLGLTYTLPEGQTFYTDAQLAKTNGFTAGTITDEDMASYIAKTSYFIDMQTSGPAVGDPFVSLSYQDLNAFGPVTDAADYFEKSKTASTQMFEAYGFTDISFEVEDYDLDGVKCASAVIRFNVGETATYQRMVGIIMDHYVAMLTATGSDESTDALLQGFHWMQ